MEIAKGHTLIYVKLKPLDRLPTILRIILFFLKINEIGIKMLIASHRTTHFNM